MAIIENVSFYIFDHSEEVPNDFYVHIMNLLKNYYEHGDNLEEIHEYLNENNSINPRILKSIRDFLKVKKDPCCNQDCNNYIHERFYKLAILTITFITVCAVVGGFGWMIASSYQG
jgi:hypothetical protein